jgi:hypothetical protein
MMGPMHIRKKKITVHEGTAVWLRRRPIHPGKPACVLGPARQVQQVPSSPALRARSVLRANCPPICLRAKRLQKKTSSVLSAIEILLVSFCFLAGTSCSKNPEPQTDIAAQKEQVAQKPATRPPKPARAESNLPPPTDQKTVNLIDPGTKPYKKIQYAFKAGYKETVQVTATETTSTKSGRKETPAPETAPVNYELKTNVESVDNKEGISKWQLIFDKSSTANDPTKTTTTFIGEMLKALYGIPGIQSITDQGLIQETDIKVPEKSPRPLRNAWQRTQRISQNLIPFPNEPIGIGARWELIEDIRAVGSTRQTTKYELVALDKRGGTVKAEITQVGRPGIVPEMSNRDVEYYLDSWNAHGEARFEFRFNSIVASGQLTITTDSTYTSESDYSDSVTNFHTVQTVETVRASSRAKKQ